MASSAPNYHKKMEQSLATLPKEPLPVLFLHACCAPCSSHVLQLLSPYFSIRLFFYNPNITDETEYRYRLAELHRLVHEMPLPNPVEIIEGRYVPASFLSHAEGLETEPERGSRCRKCIAHRLEETFAAAVQNGADFVCTTLSISPHKDATFINEAGLALAQRFGIPWLPSDFKKGAGYLHSIALSTEYHLYRQDYCGCIYSKEAAALRKAQNNAYSSCSKPL